MANIDVNVTDGNNINLVVSPSASSTLVVESGFSAGVAMELYPAPTQVINIDRGVPGNGIASVSVVDIDGSQYLRITFTNGTSSDVGPIATSTYFGVSPIVVTGDQISLSTVPVLLGGTGATTASGARSNLGLGTLATQNASAVEITGGSITGITDLAIADGGTGASTAEGARTNLGLGSAAVLNAGVANGVATLDSGGTVPLSQIPASIQGGVSYQGTWNATTNTPTLTSSVGTKGYYYVVSVAGSTNLNGITNWNIGDWAIFNGTAWEKIDNTDAVTSVNGLTGTVVLTASDVGALASASSSDGSIDITQVGTNINLQVSQNSPASTLLAQVRNETGATLTKGTIVYISGAAGNKCLVSKAIATSDATSAATFGMITADINNNQNGYVTISGIVSGLNTSAYPDGTMLYLSPTTAGTYTSIKPYAPDHLVYVGIVTYSHVNQGAIQTRIQNGYELDELHNVAAQSPTNGQTIVYNSSTNLWEKNTVSLVIGVNGTLPIANGGTGQTTQAAAITALAGTQVSGQYLRSNGTNTLLSAIVAADVPTLNQNTTGTAANVTGTVAIVNGGTGQTTADAAFNALAPSQTSNSGKYLTTNGTSTSWASVDALPSQTGNSGKYLTTNGTIASWATVNAGASLSNDTTTAANLYPIFADATTGTPTTVYTSNAQYLFKPSTGELSVKAPRASNGILVNAATVGSSYTIATGDNGLSAGPVAIASGVTVTISSGSVWTVV